MTKIFPNLPKTTLTEKFCHRLRMARLEKNLSQENLAHLIGISPSNYSKIEEGVTKVDLEKLGLIAAALEKDIGYLLEINYSTYYSNNGVGYFNSSNNGQVNQGQVDRNEMEMLRNEMAQYKQSMDAMQIEIDTLKGKKGG